MVEIKTNEGKVLEYGYRWFEYHAQQRTTTFNFYLAIYSGLAAAESLLLKEKILPGSLLVSLIMILISVLFWQLDVRNCQLINIGEAIVSRTWSKCGFDETLNPVSMSAAKQAEGFRFKQLFGAIFALGGIAGLAMFGYAMAQS